MFLVGLTGGIATGKSTVSDVFRERGITIVDSDLIARQVVEPGMPAYVKLRAELGADIFDDDHGGILIREKLGQLVFSNEKIRSKVNAITHPEIRKRIALSILRSFLRGEKYVVLDTPLLFEVGYDKIVQKIVVVKCSADEQLKRLQKRDNCDEEAARARIKAQMPLEDKVRKATHVIDNDGDKQATHKQVNALVDQFNASNLHIFIRTALCALLASTLYAASKLFAWI